MKQISKSSFFLLLIFLVGFILRFYQLGVNPPSLDWDEVSLGYNAYSILKTGADEYGNFLPLSIRSFDDYKPPLYVYLSVPSVALFGLSEFAVRLPSAIFGSLLIIVVYYFVLELIQQNSKNQEPASLRLQGRPNFKNAQYSLIKLQFQIALAAAFFIAISPWSLQFSRAAFEGNVGIFFFSSGVLFFLKGLRNSKLFILSTLAFVLSVYSYHSFRLVTPLFIIAVSFLFFEMLRKVRKYTIASLAILIILTIPVFLSLKASNGAGSRLSMVTLFGQSPNLDHAIKQLEYDRKHGDILGEILHNRRIVYTLAITKGYLDHWNPDFLFLHGDGGRQHHAVEAGMLYLFELPFIFIGTFVLAHLLKSKKIITLFIWLTLAPLPSAITTGTPHPIRAIAMMPIFHILSAVGVVWFVFLLLNSKRQIVRIPIKYILFLFTFSFLILNISYYFHQYYVHTPIEYGDFWQYGNKQAIEFAASQENKYSKIIMTYTYDQPYAYYLFYKKVDPSWYQKNWDFHGDGSIERMHRIIGKYEFRNINFGEDKKIQNALLIGSPDEIPADVPHIIHEIRFPNGEVAYRIVET